MRSRQLLAGAMLGIALAGHPSNAGASDDSIVDLAINELPLLSPAETAPVLSAAELAVIQAAALTLFRFANVDGSQVLTLTVHPGSERYSVALVSVSYAHERATGPVLAGEPEAFVTEKGIRLGMRRSDVEALLGEPTYLIGDNAVYELSGESAMLRRFNMPTYSATYGFEDGRLTGFRFGFPYP